MSSEEIEKVEDLSGITMEVNKEEFIRRVEVNLDSKSGYNKREKDFLRTVKKVPYK